MANDKETMRQRLRDILYDVQDETWNAGEKDDILDMSVNRLSRRLPRPIDPTLLDEEMDQIAAITLVSGTYFYAVPTSFFQVDRVFLEDADEQPLGFLQSGWEVVGDIWAGTAKLHVATKIVESGGILVLHGSGRYALPHRADEDQSAIILDDHVPLVLQWSRAEALSRLAADRARFRQWQNANQVQNISVNELLQMIEESKRRAEDEWRTLKRWQKPVRGYLSD